MFKMLSKTSKFIVLLTVTVMLLATFASSAFALNHNQTDGSSTGNKPLSFFGYQYVDRSHIYLFFDKTMTSGTDVVAGQFTVTTHDSPYTAVDVDSISVNAGIGYSGCSITGLNKGTRVTLNLASNLEYDKLYDVKMKAATIFMGAGNTLGNYYYRNDFKFTFRTPLEGGGYSNTTPVVTFTESNGDTQNVSYESNIGVSVRASSSPGGASKPVCHVDYYFFAVYPHPAGGSGDDYQVPEIPWSAFFLAKEAGAFENFSGGAHTSGGGVAAAGHRPGHGDGKQVLYRWSASQSDQKAALLPL